MITQSSQKIEVIVRKEGAGGEKNNKETDTEDVGGKTLPVKAQTRTPALSVL